MSFFCPRQQCKSIKGACLCEKIMGGIALVIIIVVVGKRLNLF